MGHRLSTEQQIETPKELVGVYVKMPGRNLDDIALSTLDRLKGGDLRKILSNIDESQAYDLVIERGGEYKPQSDALIKFMDGLVAMAKQYIDYVLGDNFAAMDRVYRQTIKDINKDSLSSKSSYYQQIVQYAKQSFNQYIVSEVLTDPKKAFKFAKDIVQGEWKRGEDVISQSAVPSYKYARECLHDRRFPKGEPAIATHTGASVLYAANIIGGAFPMGEDAIIRNPEASYEYARYALKKAFPKGESSIAQDAESSYNYAVIVLEARFPAGEPTIAENPPIKSKYEQRFGIKL